MADLVNVLEGSHPKDVYQRSRMLSRISPAARQGRAEKLGEIRNMPRSVCLGIIEHVSTRSHAKSPVMTRVWSHDSSIVDMMLSHNGKPGRKQGRESNPTASSVRQPVAW